MQTSFDESVEVQINPDGSSSGPPAPSLSSLLSSVQPLSTTPPSSPSPSPTLDPTQQTRLNLDLKPAERDFQQLLIRQLQLDAAATAHAKTIPRPSIPIHLTAAELALHDGTDADRPIYLSILRKLYDVTDGVRYYGPGGRYHYLVGREVGRAMATGCFESSGLTYDVRGLSQEGLDAIGAWQSFYAGKYRMAGYLKGKKMDEDAPLPDDECEEKERYGGRPDV